MLTLTNDQMRSQSFANAFRKLTSTDTLPTRAAYQVTKLLSAVESAQKKAVTTFQEIANKYGEKDEKGVLKIENNGYVLSEENRPKFEAEVVELGKGSIEVKAWPLKVSDIAHVKLTPEELGAITFLISDLEEKTNDALPLHAVPDLGGLPDGNA